MRKGNGRLAAAVAAVSLVSAASALQAQTPVIDGTLDAAGYTRFATQTVQTQFGDNQSELDAGYVRIENGKLYLMITGNLESNNNKLVFFFDTKAGGQNIMRNDNPDVSFNQLNNNYAGMTHEAGFEPDYILSFSRDRPGGAEGSIYTDFSELNTDGGGTGGYAGRIDVPANQITTGTPSGGNNRGVPAPTIGYNDANVAGVSGGTDAGDPVAAEAVTTGFELVLDLPQIAALGNFRMMVGVNGASHDYWSNQFLAGLTAPQGNLGGDGAGNFTGTVAGVNFANLAGDQTSTFTYAAPAVRGWAVGGNGDWNTASNWSGGVVPNQTDARANLGQLGGIGPHTLTLTSPVVLQGLTFDSPGAYTINGSGANGLTVSGAAANDVILVNNGNHTIAAPLALGPTTRINVVGALQSLNVTGDVSALNNTVRKVGPGSLQMKSLRAGNLDVQGGTVRLGADGTNANVSRTQALSIAGGVTPTATLDVGSNAFILDFPDPNPLDPNDPPPPTAVVIEQIKAGRAGGAWTGNGITSSAAAANSSITAVGYATAADVAPGGTFMGDTVDGTTLLVKYTRQGDADLSGQTDIDDFGRLASNFNLTDTGWSKGDFNYSGGTDIDDFGLLAANFNQAAPASGARGAAVPEPASLGLLAAAAMGLTRRRRA